MIDINYKTEDGTRYTITIDYTYDHKPAILSADPNDSCDDESGLEMWILKMGPAISNAHYKEIIDDWHNGTIDGIAAQKCIDDYFGR